MRGKAYNNFSVPPALAQTCTQPNWVLTSATQRWQKNNNVKLRIDSAFTATERASIIAAFNLWNAKNSENCSNVTFDTDTEDITIADEQATSEPDIILHYWVEFRPQLGNGFNALTAWSSRPHGATAVYGQLRVAGPATTDPNWLRGLMLHEIGHSFNLDDVSGISVMGNGTMASNAITECDSAKLRTFYCPSR